MLPGPEAPCFTVRVHAQRDELVDRLVGEVDVALGARPVRGRDDALAVRRCERLARA